MTAEELQAAVDEDPDAAVKGFAGKKVELSGVVFMVVGLDLGYPAISLEVRGLPKVAVHGVSVEFASKLEKGSKVTVTCDKITEVAGSPSCRVGPDL